MFCRIQNLHISQTIRQTCVTRQKFCRIQNLHISQTYEKTQRKNERFCRIQNLHISQTYLSSEHQGISFVEFKIYISLKHSHFGSIVVFVL